MRLIELLREGFSEATTEFSQVADPAEVKQTIEKFRQLVASNKIKSTTQPGQPNTADVRSIDHWRKQGWDAFKQAVADAENVITKTQIKRQTVSGNSIILVDDDKWKVVVPLDKNASCFYGKGTNWCTAKPMQSNFEQYFYKDAVTLIYFISKDSPERYAIAADFVFGEDTEYFNRADDTITESQFESAIGEDLDIDEIYLIAGNSENIRRYDRARLQYDTAEDNLTKLLIEWPLNNKEIEKLLSFTRSEELSASYIIKYSKEVKHPVIVPDLVLLSAAEYGQKLPFDSPVLSNLAKAIDFSKIPVAITTILFRKYPKLIIKAYDRLPQSLKQLIITVPNTALQYAISIVNGEWPAGEAAIATSADTSYRYAERVIKKRFLAGEPTIAKDPYLANEYNKLFGNVL